MRSLLLGTWIAKAIRRVSSRPTSMSPEYDLHRLEVVELEAERGRWPIGTRGTIVELADSAALVEIADDRGHTLDLIEIPAAS
jgi:hypothetical protein